jgi:hypothetical protein
MAYAVLTEQELIEALEAELALVDGTTDQWRFDFRGKFQDHLPRTPDQVDVEQCPWITLLPGDWDVQPEMSQKRKGTSQVLLGVIVRPDATRFPGKSARVLGMEVSAEVRKVVEQRPQINCHTYEGMRVDLIVDPLGRFAMLGAAITYRTRATFGA